MEYHNEIRQSDISELGDKVKKQNYGAYLLKISINKVRGFSSAEINFDFPVTALIGPNGGGKSSILGSAACAYKQMRPGQFFPKSSIGDDSMSGWVIEYEMINKIIKPRSTIRRSANFRQLKWVRGEVIDRNVIYFGIERTVPAGEKPNLQKLKNPRYQHQAAKQSLSSTVSSQIEHVLGKSVSNYKTTLVSNIDFYIGSDGVNSYSEFHFGAGESSVIRMIERIESSSENTLILIEEIENGLHPIAAQRMVEYLIDAAKRKSIQVIFTTHSDYALLPLPNEAIWACTNGSVMQGKLSVKTLRAVTGRVDKKLAIFVEDDFAKEWVSEILRTQLGDDFIQIEIHPVCGDGNARSVHLNHKKNPAINSNSICIIDGDSQQSEDDSLSIFRLPGKNPERAVFDSVLRILDDNIAILTVACHRGPEEQNRVLTICKDISITNRDPHLLYNQVGMKMGFVSEIIIRGAFLSLWVRNNTKYCKDLAQMIKPFLS